MQQNRAEEKGKDFNQQRQKEARYLSWTNGTVCFQQCNCTRDIWVNSKDPFGPVILVGRVMLTVQKMGLFWKRVREWSQPILFELGIRSLNPAFFFRNCDWRVTQILGLGENGRRRRMCRRNPKGPEGDFGFEFGREFVHKMELGLVEVWCEL